MLSLLSAIVGIASWYGPELAGRPTASGEPFDPAALTAASWYYPFGTELEITNPATGKTVKVIVNDRGPARRLGRIIDLSQASFAHIADLDQGLVKVQVRVADDD
jgi:rare lipoprotein A